MMGNKIRKFPVGTDQGLEIVTECLIQETPQLRKSAVLSECGRYRYLLTRAWDDALPAALFVMLNPSTADAETDDATIRRCLGFARHWQCGSIRVVNLFAWRATKPADLPMLYGEAIGPANDATIIAEARAAAIAGGPVVCAWGARGGLAGRDRAVLEILRDAGASPLCIRETARGMPEHPLYLPATLLTQPYDGPRARGRRPYMEGE